MSCNVNRRVFPLDELAIFPNPFGSHSLGFLLLYRNSEQFIEIKTLSVSSTLGYRSWKALLASVTEFHPQPDDYSHVEQAATEPFQPCRRGMSPSRDWSDGYYVVAVLSYRFAEPFRIPLTGIKKPPGLGAFAF